MNNRYGEWSTTCSGSIANREVTTIEGLSADATHAVQRAWLQEDVPQCGYCQAGQIMAVADLLRQVPDPSDDDIDPAPQQHLSLRHSRARGGARGVGSTCPYRRRRLPESVAPDRRGRLRPGGEPNGVRAQMEGGACDALSTALGEELTIEGGRHRETNFHQYRLMRIGQAPAEIDVHVVQGGAEPAGLGEPPVPPLAPALANAVFAASGIRIRRLPIQDQLKRDA